MDSWDLMGLSPQFPFNEEKVVQYLDSALIRDQVQDKWMNSTYE